MLDAMMDEGLPFASEMGWTVPQFSRDDVDAAGKALLKPAATEQDEWALSVINNWRSSHAFPLNTFQVGLRNRAKAADDSAVIAQRIKRLSSIEAKLRRFKTMKLSHMQDIGGCRAVLRTVRQVNEAVAAYLASDLKHKLDHADDYIREPKNSGYRGVHLIYRYNSDKKATYNGLRIEVQIRSQLQHAWATAVETVGTFIRQALKSSQGEEEWLRFFALMGSAIALREKTPPVPYTPGSKEQLVKDLRGLASELNVQSRLSLYGSALRSLEVGTMRDAHYFLLVLNPTQQTLSVSAFSAQQLELASNRYLAAERAVAKEGTTDAVLVSVESLASLRRAYPNYFLDTSAFIEAVRQAIA